MVRFAAAALALITSLIGLSASGNQILLLEFSTPACGPCRQMEPLIRLFEQQGYPIRKVDATREPQLAQQFQVNRFPTFVMLAGGREVNRHVGMTDTNQLVGMFKEARDRVVAEQQQRQPQDVALAAEERVIEETVKTIDPSHAALIRKSVRLRVDDGKYRSFATGTIVDARDGEALVITCGHLFRDLKDTSEVSIEMFEANDGRVEVVGQVWGKLLSCDLERDVALVYFSPGRPVTPVAIAPAGSRVERGDRVVSIGCSNGDDPTAMPTRITALDRYQGPPNIEAGGAPAVGRSGGGLFNDQGELIGVCYASDHEGNEGLYAALESIHDQIGRLNLQPNGSLAKSASADSFARGQFDDSAEARTPRDEPVAAAGNLVTIGPTTMPKEKPAGLSPVEQAAWDEIANRAVDSEVIIIVRPKAPGGQSEVISLDNVSQEFVRAIAGRQSEPQSAITR